MIIDLFLVQRLAVVTDEDLQRDILMATGSFRSNHNNEREATRRTLNPDIAKPWKRTRSPAFRALGTLIGILRQSAQGTMTLESTMRRFPLQLDTRFLVFRSRTWGELAAETEHAQPPL